MGGGAGGWGLGAGCKVNPKERPGAPPGGGPFTVWVWGLCSRQPDRLSPPVSLPPPIQRGPDNQNRRAALSRTALWEHRCCSGSVAAALGTRAFLTPSVRHPPGRGLTHPKTAVLLVIFSDGSLSPVPSLFSISRLVSVQTSRYEVSKFCGRDAQRGDHR